MWCCRVDLNGFTIEALGTNLPARGILAFQVNIEIRNGTVRGFQSNGIEGNPGAEKLRVIDVRSIQNQDYGIRINGHGGFIDRCDASGGLNGIYISRRGLVLNSTASNLGGGNSLDTEVGLAGSDRVGFRSTHLGNYTPNPLASFVDLGGNIDATTP